MTTSGTKSIASHELPATRLDPKLAAKRAEKIKVSMISLCGCWGCTLSFLDVDERLLALLDKITILRCSLTDVKRIPERCAIGFIEGGVANEENIHTLQHFRENCDILISVGACAIWGGVPAMRNLVGLRECLEEAYLHGPTVADGGVIPNDPDLPLLLDRVYPAHEVVRIDYLLPGCPPSADAIWQGVTNLLAGQPPGLPYQLLKYE